MLKCKAADTSMSATVKVFCDDSPSLGDDHDTTYRSMVGGFSILILLVLTCLLLSIEFVSFFTHLMKVIDLLLRGFFAFFMVLWIMVFFFDLQHPSFCLFSCRLGR
jgi:hypothetical protein